MENMWQVDNCLVLAKFEHTVPEEKHSFYILRICSDSTLCTLLIMSTTGKCCSATFIRMAIWHTHFRISLRHWAGLKPLVPHKNTAPRKSTVKQLSLFGYARIGQLRTKRQQIHCELLTKHSRPLYKIRNKILLPSWEELSGRNTSKLSM